MSKQIATRVFYSYIGYDKDLKEISKGHGETDKSETEEVYKICLERVRRRNEKIVDIVLLAVTPLEFETVESDRPVIQKEIDWKNKPYINGFEPEA